MQHFGLVTLSAFKKAICCHLVDQFGVTGTHEIKGEVRN